MSAAKPGREVASAPFLTVVMPVHGGERWIGTTLDSLAAEAADDVEVLVIDSSPERGTAESVLRYADRFKLALAARTDLTNGRTKTHFGVEPAPEAAAQQRGGDMRRG